METKLPLISYVVKTQFITNNSGLRRIHQQVFTNQDILFAREKAFEYYEAGNKCFRTRRRNMPR